MRIKRLSALVIMLATTALAGAAEAATCRDPAGFQKWLGDVRREALAQGIPARAVQVGLDRLDYDPGVVARDQGPHFNSFAGSILISQRLGRAQSLLARYAGLLGHLEQRYGVPGPILVAIWGLESDFGANRGNLSALRSVATLAFDCRRSAKFMGELYAGLRLIARGDMNPLQPHSSWAGEIGQTQFMLSSYLKYGVDGDGDGRIDLVGSAADALASTANYLRGHGWARGGSWEPGSHNYAVLRAWNLSDSYARTVSEFASRLAPARSARTEEFGAQARLSPR